MTADGQPLLSRDQLLAPRQPHHSAAAAEPLRLSCSAHCHVAAPPPFGQVVNTALDLDHDEAPVEIDATKSGKDDFLGLAFKLEEGRFGQLTCAGGFPRPRPRGPRVPRPAAESENETKVKR